MITFFTNVSSTTVFNIDDNKKSYLSTLKWFLNDRVMQKTEVIADKNSALPSLE